MSAKSPYINRHMSLISKSGARYDGILTDVNPETKTITLIDVRAFGTESRRSGKDSIPAVEGIYAEVCFKSSDIDQIKFQEQEEKKPAVEVQPMAFDPAIISARKAQTSTPKSMGVSSASLSRTETPPATSQKNFSVSVSSSSVHTPPAPKPASTFVHPSKTLIFSANPASSSGTRRVFTYTADPNQEQTSTRRSVENQSYASAVGFNSSGKQQQMNQQTSHRRHYYPNNSNRRQHSVPIPRTAFDFESANAQLDKASIVSGIEEGYVSYNPSKSFFDNISCETRDGRTLVQDDRRTNMETFGQFAPRHSTSYRYHQKRGMGQKRT